MSDLIRQASGRSNVLTLMEPSRATDVEPVGRSSVGRGSVVPPPYKRRNDAANDAIRQGAQLARSLTVPGGVDISDLFNG
jgi:hypothetical protein